MTKTKTKTTFVTKIPNISQNSIIQYEIVPKLNKQSSLQDDK